MTAELISVGTEILMGNILNSNARYLAEKCASLGLDMYYQVTVGDNYDRMMSVVTGVPLSGEKTEFPAGISYGENLRIWRKPGRG